MKHRSQPGSWRDIKLSVLSVEPYGMKLYASFSRPVSRMSFSALGRAVWDETTSNGRSP